MKEEDYYLSADQIANGLILCLDNAAKLIEESEILFNNKRYARSLSLAILSLEELGKIPMILAMLNIRKKDKKEIKKFFKRFKSHIAKREDTYVPFYAELFLLNRLGKNEGISEVAKKSSKLFEKLGSLYTKMPKEIKKLLEEKNVEKIKLRGFYVDYSKSNFVSPNTIDDKMTRHFLDLSKASLKKYQEHWKSRDEKSISRIIKLARDKKKSEKYRNTFFSFFESLLKEMNIPDERVKKMVQGLKKRL